MRRIARGLAVAIACLGVAATGCRKERVTPSRPVAECLSSMQSAADKNTAQEVTSTYYAGCAEMFSVQACQVAWKQAAKATPDQQLEIVATDCRKAYCPDMGALSLDICRDDFDGSKAS